MHASEHGTLEWPQKSNEKKKKEAVTFCFSHPHQLVLMINTRPASPTPLSYIYNIIVDTKNTIFYKQSVKPYIEKS